MPGPIRRALNKARGAKKPKSTGPLGGALKKLGGKKPVSKAAPKAPSNAPKTSTRGMSAAKRGEQPRSAIRDMPDAPRKTKPTPKKTPGVRKFAKPGNPLNSKRGR